MNRQQQAKRFAEKWSAPERGREKSDTQPFWLSLLRVYGAEEPEDLIEFEGPVYLGHNGNGVFDAAIPSASVLIEQKSRGVDLDKPARQSNGEMLTPIYQAMKYIVGMPRDLHPTWVITCNFDEFRVYDMNAERPGESYESIKLENLPDELYRMEFLTSGNCDTTKKELEVSVAAGNIVGKLYDALYGKYRNPASASSLHSLNVLCVRLVFCLYAEDSGIFEHAQFHNYLNSFRTEQMRNALIELFQVLDQREEQRDPYLAPTLKAFPYVNGGLFQDEKVEIPLFTEEIRNLILVEASEQFDWSKISPTIFGAVFESTLNPETRRAGGMHYTSVENIHKVLDPLFLDDLKEELEAALTHPNRSTQTRMLRAFRDRLSTLRFLDPACGSGNFLTETYLSLRQLENRALKARLEGVAGQVAIRGMLSDEELGIRVGIGQFYGIEINDFAVSVARTALWIAEHQMMRKTSEIVQRDLDFLPLKTDAHIVEGNALRIDWNDVAPRDQLSYIIGNPPFAGRRYRTREQTDDLALYFKYKDIDYVACWYKKAAIYMQGTDIRAALVSTNSITQGEQVKALWEDLVRYSGLQINFAHRTFQWDSEAYIKAHVHCVIIGFTTKPVPGPKRIYDGGSVTEVQHINGYLNAGPDVFIGNRSKPLCNVPGMKNGNVPLDGDALKIEPEDLPIFKNCMQYVKRLIGGRELLHGEMRYVLWLPGVSTAEISKYPAIVKRVALCRERRLAMDDPSSVKLASRPTTFRDTNNPAHFIALPMVSSERRTYLPMDYFDANTIPTNQVQIIPGATLYHFAVLSSRAHMAWMRVVCGRLEMRYRYSKSIVYNNFPWPVVTPEQEAEIAGIGQAILDARAAEPGASLAVLYNDALMPERLRAAHEANDRAVLAAYGLPADTPEPDIVAHLMQRYQVLAGT